MISKLAEIIKNSRIGKGLAVAGVSLAFNTGLFADDAEDTFKAIYGKKEAEINKSKDAGKHLDFGKRLFEESKKNKPLEEVLEEHAIKHLKKHKDGYSEVFEIHKDDMQDFPSDKDKYLNNLIKDAEELSKKLKYNDPNRKEINNFIAENSLLLGDVLEENGDYSSAADAFKNAGYKFRNLRKYGKLKESRKRQRENEKFAKKYSDLKGRELGIELLKKGEYSKALEHLKEGKYSSAVEFLTSDTDEKIVPSNKLSESYLNKTLENIEKKDKEKLSEILKPYCLINDLRDEVVVSLSMLDNEPDWDYIDTFGAKIKKYFDENAETPGFDLEGALKTARAFDDLAAGEERRYVKRDIMLKAVEQYKDIGKNAKKGSLAAVEAGKKISSLGKELEKYKGIEVKDLEMKVGEKVDVPKDAVLYMSFDKDTIVRGESIKDGNIINEGKGDNWYVKDLSGKGNHGEVYGGKSKIVKGVKGEALKFDGIDDCVLFNASKLPKGSLPRTISSWIKPYDTSEFKMWFSYGEASDTKGWSHEIGRNHPGTISLNSHGLGNIYSSNNRIKPHEWNNIVICYDSTDISIYINGKLSKTEKAFLNTSNKNACLGKRNYAKSFNYIGIIDEVAIFDRALKPREIESSYKKIKNLIN